MTSANGTIIVTGANGGLGSAIVTQIVTSPELAANYYGIYTVRNVEKASALKHALAHAPPMHKHEEISLDLSKLLNVRKFATIITQRVAEGSLPPIRALILNAGYQEHTEQYFSEDGFDMSFQCNYLSHWLLTLMLLRSMDKKYGRIVVLGSSTHDPNDPRNDSIGMFRDDKWKVLFHDTDSLAKGTWSSPKDDPSAQAGFRRYGASKLCAIMMIYELQRRLDDDPSLSNISVLGVDPGGMPTGLTRRGSFLLNTIGMKLLVPILASILVKVSPNGPLRTAAKSARDVLSAALDTQTLGERPKTMYLNGSDSSFQTSAEARDATKQATLWRDSVAYTNLKASDTALVRWC